MRALNSILMSIVFLAAGSAFADHHFAALEQGIDSFYADTTAHKMRLTVRTHELMNNPKFFEALPEYKELQKYKEEVVRLVMEHDSSKLYLSRDSETIKIAGEMNGRYWRSLPDSDPLKEKAKKAFAELTRIDTAHEGQSAQQLFKGNPKAQKLAEEFMKMIDYDDVPKMRGNEFGSTTRKKSLRLASDWIQTPEIKTKLSDDEYRRLLKLGKVLESKDFAYSNAVKYYTSEMALNKKFEDLAKPFYRAKYPESHFALLEKKFAPETALVGKASYLKALKAAPAILIAGSQSYQYAKNPDRNIPENFLKGLVLLSNDKPYCKGYQCHLLQMKCARKQNVKESEVDWKSCSQYFYSLSLDQQDAILVNTQQKEDKDLKDYFQDQAPLISDITCPRSKKDSAIDVVVSYRPALSYGYQQQSQKLSMRTDGSLSEVVIPGTDKTFTRISFDSQSNPVRIQECESKVSCSNLSVDSVKKFGIKSPAAKRWMSFSQLQNQNIANCCQNSSCVSYFEKKYKKASEPAASAMAAISIK